MDIPFLHLTLSPPINIWTFRFCTPAHSVFADIDGRNFTSYITHRKENVYYLSDGTNIIAINAPKEWIDQMYKSTLLGEEGGGDH